jgi:Type III secretion protein (HpaP)
MKPVGRVRWDSGGRAGAGMREARAGALRTRFQQLLHGGDGGAPGLPGVTPTLTWRDAPSSSAGRCAGLEAVTAQLHAMPAGAAASPQATAAALEAALLQGAQGAAVLCDARPSCGAPNGAVPQRSDDAAASPWLAAPNGRGQPQQQQQLSQQQASPHRPSAAGGAQRELPALVRDLVQAVVQLARGREGQWRLTMALKPQVLGGTWLTLDARPGRLRVRFDCAGADARARLEGVREALRLRLAETLSAIRPIEVSIEVRIDAHRDIPHDVHGAEQEALNGRA